MPDSTTAHSPLSAHWLAWRTVLVFGETAIVFFALALLGQVGTTRQFSNSWGMVFFLSVFAVGVIAIVQMARRKRSVVWLVPLLPVMVIIWQVVMVKLFPTSPLWSGPIGESFNPFDGRVAQISKGPPHYEWVVWWDAGLALISGFVLWGQWRITHGTTGREIAALWNHKTTGQLPDRSQLS